jgi:putative membrane protein
MTHAFRPIHSTIAAAIFAATTLATVGVVAAGNQTLQSPAAGSAGTAAPSKAAGTAISPGRAASLGTGSVVGSDPSATGSTTAGSTTVAQSPATATPPASTMPASGSAPSSAKASGSPAKAAGSGAAKLSGLDRQFAIKAIQDGMAEVSTAKLAAANAASADVKKFGEHMAQDHSKAGDELKQIAQNKGIAVPADTDRMHQKLAKQLQAMNGDKFDRLYMREGVKDHKSAVALFTKEAKNGKDPELRAFAGKTLPKLKEHLALAQQVNGSVNAKR